LFVNDNRNCIGVVRIVGFRNETGREDSLCAKARGEGLEGVLVVRFADNLYEAVMSRGDADRSDNATPDLVNPGLRWSFAPRLCFSSVWLCRTRRFSATAENCLKDRP
jgi:hypothetical protein